MRIYFLRSLSTLFSGISQFLLHFVLNNASSATFYGNFVYGLSLTQKAMSFVDPSLSNYFFFESLKMKSAKLIDLINYYLILVYFILIVYVVALDSIAMKIAVSFVVIQWMIGVVTKVADVLEEISVEKLRLSSKVILLFSLLGFWSLGEGLWSYIILLSILGIGPFILVYIARKKVLFKSTHGVNIKGMVSFILPLLFSSWVLNGFSAIELWYYQGVIGTEGFSTYGSSMQIGMVLSLLGVGWLQLLTRDYSRRGSLVSGSRAYYLLLASGLILFLLLNSGLLKQYELGSLPASIVFLSIANSIITFSNQLRGNISQLDSGSLNYSKTSVYSFVVSIFFVIIFFGFNLGIETLILRGLYQSYGQSLMLFRLGGKKISSLVIIDGILVLISTYAVLF